MCIRDWLITNDEELIAIQRALTVLGGLALDETRSGRGTNEFN